MITCGTSTYQRPKNLSHKLGKPFMQASKAAMQWLICYGFSFIIEKLAYSTVAGLVLSQICPVTLKTDAESV